MNKKKILTLSLVVAVIAIAMVSGSLAWFTDSDQVTNVFTVGSVKIVQNEEFQQNSQLMPIVPHASDPTDPSKAGNFVTKKVDVSNVGKNAAYIQTFVAVPAVLDNNNILEIYDANAAANGWTKTAAPVATGVSGTQILPGSGDTNLYNIYKYAYNSALAVNTTTADVIEGVYINADVDLDVLDAATAYFVVNGSQVTGFNALETVNVYVATQAIQVDGFENAASALATFDTHPWAS